VRNNKVCAFQLNFHEFPRLRFSEIPHCKVCIRLFVTPFSFYLFPLFLRTGSAIFLQRKLSPKSAPYYRLKADLHQRLLSLKRFAAAFMLSPSSGACGKCLSRKFLSLRCALLTCSQVGGKYVCTYTRSQMSCVSCVVRCRWLRTEHLRASQLASIPQNSKLISDDALRCATARQPTCDAKLLLSASGVQRRWN
jgi:hypothetical protein